MELRKSISISLLVHIMLVGSALSFAGIVGSISRDSNSIITVSLFNGNTETKTSVADKPKTEKSGSIKKTKTASSLEEQEDYSDYLPVQVTERFSLANADLSKYALSQTTEKASHNKTAETSGNNTTGEYIQSIYNSILSAIEKAKTYPFIARKKKLEGTVVAEFMINRSGSPEKITLKKSSGHKILDNAAMNIIEKAAPLPKTEHIIIVPITFSLKDMKKPE